ncbi:Variant Ionotropic Glutamate Receptor [Penaeus vannamei]|uniref:Variant Ionotropic Glutamate Receptor n=1 Tax=Penaeus vannamei TaxID=6689 RepID=A0A3R7LU12_PENVA|nr:Variant Ionotropic Glutamate Receptor [Penaeus vannamei]
MALMFPFVALVFLATAAQAASGNAWLAPMPDGLPGVGKALGAVLAIVPPESKSFIVFTDGVDTDVVLKAIGDTVDLPSVAVMEVSSGQEYNTTMKRLIGHARKQVRQSFRGVTVVVVSEDLDFLSAFAEMADAGRLSVWDNRVLVVTRLERRQFLGLMKDLWLFSMLNTMLINMDDDADDIRCGAQTVRVATWTPKKGMVYLTEHPLFPEKFTNFHGAALPIAIWPFEPVMMQERVVAPNGTEYTRLYGRGIRILEAIAGHLNFAIGEALPARVSKDGAHQRLQEECCPASNQLKVPVVTNMKLTETPTANRLSACNASLIRPTVNTINFQRMDHVLYRRALISPQKLALLPHLALRYDYTFMIEEATLTFCMAKPELKPRWQNLYYPLGERVWASIMALLVIVPATFFLLTKSRMRREAKEKFSLLAATEQVFGTLLGQSFSLPTVSSTRVLVASWLVVAFVLGSAYRGNLTAFLTIPKYPPRLLFATTLPSVQHLGLISYHPKQTHLLNIAFQKPTTLSSSNYRVIMSPDLKINFYTTFKESNSSMSVELAERTYFSETHLGGMQQALEKK